MISIIANKAKIDIQKIQKKKPMVVLAPPVKEEPKQNITSNMSEQASDQSPKKSFSFPKIPVKGILIGVLAVICLLGLIGGNYVITNLRQQHLLNYIQRAFERGHDEDKIRQKLKEAGWVDHEVAAHISKAKKKLLK